MATREPSELDKLIDKKCFDILFQALADHVSENPGQLDLDGRSNFVEEPDAATLNDMEIIRITDANVDEDCLSFNVVVSAEIEIEETVRRNRESDSSTQWFSLRCDAVLDVMLKQFRVTGINVYVA